MRNPPAPPPPSRKPAVPGRALMRGGPDPGLAELKAAIRAQIAETMRACHAESTKRSYASLWRRFTEFCEVFGYAPIPASLEAVLEFLCVYGTGRTAGTLRNSYSAVRYHHQLAGLPCEHGLAVRSFLAGHRRLYGRPADQKAPVGTDVVKQICAELDTLGGVKATRDKALLLKGFAGAFRASEMVANRVENLRFDHRGVTILIPRSKTDQEGNGQTVTIVRTANPATCPVVALEEWIEALTELRGARSGVLFPVLRAAGDSAIREARLAERALTTDDYRKILKKLCEGAGMDRRTIGGHSLRAGHATQAADNGASVFEIAAQGRWKTLQMVMLYFRMGNRHRNNSSNRLGL